MALELNLTKNTNDVLQGTLGKYYARVEYKGTISKAELAEHMHEHNAIYSQGLVEGILTDAAKCIRELILQGYVVKIDNLGLFKASVDANGLTLEKGSKISAGRGAQRTEEELAGNPAAQQFAVGDVKFIMQATGNTTIEKMNDAAKLSFTSKTKAEVKRLTGSDVTDDNGGGGGSDSGNGGSQSGNGGSEQGGNSGSQSNSQNQATSFALSITKSGSGTSTVKNDSEETINSGDSLESGANVYIAVTPAEGQIPTATLNGSNVSLTENDGEYVGTFQMPAQASTLVINSGSDGEEGDQN
jgi:hypothetical protein